MKLVNITAQIKHDSQVFYPGERRMLSDEDADYFCAHGWANVNGESASPSVPSDVTLEVKNGSHSTKGKVL